MFKETRVKPPTKDVLPEKPNHIKHCKDNEMGIKEPDLANPKKHDYRWASLEN